MNCKMILSASALALMASGAMANNWSGEIGFSYALPTDSDNRSVTEYFGAVEYAITRDFSVGLDLAGYLFEEADATVTSSTWHFMYHYNDLTSLSFFTGADVVVSDEASFDATFAETVTFAGFEAGMEFGIAEGEAYLGVASHDEIDETLTMFGLAGAYRVTDAVSAIGHLDILSGDGARFSDLALGVSYDISDGPELYGKLGNRAMSVDDGNDENAAYVEIGASLAFGNARGATFQRRSMFESAPIFE